MSDNIPPQPTPEVPPKNAPEVPPKIEPVAKPTITRDVIHKIITHRMENQRPIAWEDDISANTLDDAPFENLPAPNKRPIEKFEEVYNHDQVLDLLGGQTLADAVAKDTWPIPCAADREGYFVGQDEHYWMFGLADYLKAMASAKQHDVHVQSVLDFGCASGRVIRHFAAQSGIPTIWGSDINQRHVRWLCENMPRCVRPISNHCIPTLPIPDASVDLITAFSVFTHIDTFETHWLAELSRILSPGGLCYLTVHNEDTWDEIAKEIDNKENRLVQTIIKNDPDVVDQLTKPMPKDRLVYRFTHRGPYRANVFLSNAHLERVWGRFFDIAEILPLHHARQTVVVLKKRSP